MAKVKVMIDGREHEVDLPEGYGQKADFQQEFTSRFDGEFERRAKTLKASTRDELSKDDEFVKAILAARGIDPDAKPPVSKPDTAEINALRTRWESAELEPVRTKYTALEAQYTSTLSRILEQEIENAAREAGVRPEMLMRIGSSKPAIVSQLRDAFTFDADTGYHALKGKGDRLVPAASGSDDRPWAGALDYLQQLKTDKQYAGLFVTAAPQTGAKLQGGTSQNGGTTTTSASGKPVVDRNDPLAFGRMAADIASGKAEVSEQ